MDYFLKLICYASLIGLTICTTDINFKQLQYVAGELEPEECRKLVEALHNNTLFTDEKQTFTGEKEPNKTCLFLLLKYDRTDGKGKIFLDLAIRLRQIGRHDLADKLSTMVYHEKSLALQKNFIDDPYRKMIRENSFLLDEEKTQKKVIKPKEGFKFNWAAFWICCAVLSFSMLTCVAFQICCPQLGKSLWQRFVSEGLIELCSFCDYECSRCWQKFKFNYRKYVVGKKLREEFDDEEKLLNEAQLAAAEVT